MALATLWANQIIAGNAAYKDVPARLEEKAASVLTAAGCEDLVAG